MVKLSFVSHASINSVIEVRLSFGNMYVSVRELKSQPTTCLTCPYAVPNFSQEIGSGILPSGYPTISCRLMMLAAAAQGMSSEMSPYMLSSTWWLDCGGFRFPVVSLNTPLLIELAIASVNSDCSIGDACALNVNLGRYVCALVRMSCSLHSFWASCCLACSSFYRFPV